MAKFCTKCGKPLENGKECSCTENTKTTTVESNGTLVQECIEIIKNVLKKPIDTLEENIDEEKTNNAFVMVGLDALAIGLFVVVLVKEVFGELMGVMGTLMGGNSYTSLMGLGSSYQVEIPYVKYFFIAVIFGAISMLAMAGIATLISNKLLNGNTSFKKMITLFGFSSIISTVSLLIATVCLFIDVRLSLVVYMAGASLNTYYSYKGLEYACETDRNKLGYILMPAALITTFVISYIIPNIIF